MDLAEFTNDYWNTYLENGGARPDPIEIAEAFCERTVPADAPDEVYRAEVEKIAPQVAYYLPSGGLRNAY